MGMSRPDAAGTSRISNVQVRSRAPSSALIIIKRNLPQSGLDRARKIKLLVSKNPILFAKNDVTSFINFNKVFFYLELGIPNCVGHNKNSATW
jgi:hypothetical protein